MAKMDIAIDLGTSFTSIFVSGNGIVLHEPSVLAYYDTPKRTMRAVGAEAYEMIGKAADNTKIVCPIIDGVISDPDACAVMLGEFIRRIMPQSYIIRPRIHAVLGVPIGITVEERKTLEEVLMRSGVDEIDMVNSIMLAGLGMELPVASTFGGFIVSIGGGTTEMAALSLCGIVNGSSINIGGDMIDRTLLDGVRVHYRMKVEPLAVRGIKEQILSLVRNDGSAMSVSGMDVERKCIVRKTVNADKLYDTVFAYYSNIFDAVQNAINACPPSVAAEIQRSGVNVVGGGAKIPGLAIVMREALGLRVRIPQDPEFATVLGGGQLLSDPALADDILRHA